MIRCTRCGSGYDGVRTLGMENCPRCLTRDQVAAPLVFKAFQLPDSRKPRLTGSNANQYSSDARAG